MINKIYNNNKKYNNPQALNKSLKLRARAKLSLAPCQLKKKLLKKR